MANLVADVSSYQPDNYDFFKALKDEGVKAVVVKITEGSADGTAYVNPKARNQILNTIANGMRVHAYHYARFNGTEDAKNEANFFTDQAKKLGIGQDSVMVLDAEDGDLQYNVTDDCNAFIQQVKNNGYPNTDIYVMASWVWYGRIDLNKIISKNRWIASSGATQPGVDNVGMWQYTSTYPVYGLQMDMSYDFNGFYSDNKTVKQGEYFENGHWRFYENGELIKGWYWINEPGKTVFYDDNGNMVYGQQKINGHWYLFDKVTGAMQRGFQNLSNYGENKTVYYNQDGWMLYGWQKIDGKDYYFEPDNGAVMHSVKFDKNGVASW